MVQGHLASHLIIVTELTDAVRTQGDTAELERTKAAVKHADEKVE